MEMRFELLLAMVIVTFACATGAPPSNGDEVVGSGDGDASGQSGDFDWSDGIPISEVCDAFERDMCNMLLECDAFDYLGYRSVQDCLADQECFGAADLVAEVDAGWLTYDAQVVYLCHQEWAADPCALWLGNWIPTVQQMLSECTNRLVGIQGEEADCVHDLDCVAGTYCAVASMTCGGSCQIWAQETESCDDYLVYCDPGADLSCINNTCTGPADTGSECWSNTDCSFSAVDGLWCDTGVNECTSPVGLNEACSGPLAEGPRCAEGLWCDSPSSSGTGVCRDVSSSGGDCLWDANCDVGLSCFQDYPYGSCQPPNDDGGPCGTTSNCIDGYYCAGPSWVCAPLPGVGESCSTFAPCESDLACVDGYCRENRYPGDSCIVGTHHCVGSVCLLGTCEYRSGLDEPCEHDDDCASRSCDTEGCIDPTLCLP